MRRVVVRLVLGGLVAVAGVLVMAPPAAACSCAGPPPAASEAVAQSDAAFVGTLTRVDDPSGSRPVISSGRMVSNHFAVEAVAKGGLGATVVVDAAAEGASCGLELAVGQRAGLLLWSEDGRWRSGLCSKVDPDELAAISVLPRTGGGSELAANLGIGLLLAALALVPSAVTGAQARHDPAPQQPAGS